MSAMGIAAGFAGAAVWGITSVGADVAALDTFEFGVTESDLFEIKLAAVVEVVGVIGLNCTRFLPTEVVLNCAIISIQLTRQALKYRETT
jgi:hypothetical protein